MEFTKEELIEIEKIFDWYVIKNCGEIITLAEKVMKLIPEQDFGSKLFDDAVSAHNMHRNISAKAKLMRDE